jgi:hypothetical protein
LWIVIETIILRIIFNYFCKTFLIFVDFVCIFNASFSSRIISRILSTRIFFIMFLIITSFNFSLFSSLTMLIVNSLICLIVFELKNFSTRFSTRFDIAIDSTTNLTTFVLFFDFDVEFSFLFCSCSMIVCILWRMSYNFEFLLLIVCDDESIVNKTIVWRNNFNIFEFSTIFTRCKYFFIFVLSDLLSTLDSSREVFVMLMMMFIFFIVI